jgi:TonB-linked SusC/RagA family outer membrane protein
MTTMITMNRARALSGALLLGVLSALPGARAQAQAQNAVITGRVVSEFGQTIEAANVYIEELSLSVGTNAQGTYTITVPAARVQGQQVNLRVRAISYQPGVSPIRLTAGSQTVNFTLKQDVNRLNEVVVTGTVGLGTERAKVPFAIARLDTQALKVPALDPITALEGKVSGLRIAQTSSGAPGSTPEIMMRGPTSINASGRDRSPLFIVDGVIMNVGSFTELGALDIESIEVVKGAAGASLYGTRAANGVITITTKRGSGGSDGVHFSGRTEYGVNDLNSISYGQPVNHHLQLDETGTRFCVAGSGNVAACSRTINWMQEILRINSVAADTTRKPQSLQWNSPTVGGGDLQNVYQANYWPGQYFNSMAQATQSNPITLNSLDATGKVGTVRFYVSGSYQNNEGALRDLTGNQQRRARINLDYDARQDLTFSVSSAYDNGRNDNRGDNGLFGTFLRGAPAGTNYLARDSLGRGILVGGGSGLRGTGNGGATFLYDDEHRQDWTISHRFIGDITSRYFPAPWVTVEGVFGYDNRNTGETFYLQKGYRTTSLSTSTNNGRIDLFDSGDESMNGSLTSTFKHALRNDLNGQLQIRGSWDQERSNNNDANGQAFTVKDVFTLSNTTLNPAISSSLQTVRNMGALAGASLDYKDRYILDGTFRYDGSSLFGPGNRWAPFGRVSGVWRVSEEPWWNQNWLSDFRLRASHGTAGSTPRFSAQYETYSVNNGVISLGQSGNSKLKPETTTEDEIGTDFTLFSRLGVELTHAGSDTRNQLLLVNTPNSLGFATQWQNAGTLSNNTWELGLNLPVLNRKNFSWNMHGTWDRTRTYITQLFAPEYVTDGGTGQGTGSFFLISARHDLSNGQPINRFGQIWGRKFYKKCGDMPSSLQGSCGDGKEFQVNDQGYVVFVGEGNSWKDGITKNLWQTYLPGAQSPFGNNVPLYWGMPIVDRPLRGQPGEGTGINQIIGNVFPNFRFTYNNDISYKRFTAYALLDATIGNNIDNQGEGWGLLDFNSSHFDQGGASLATAKPVGYSWRSGPSESTGVGGFYDTLNPNNYVVEDGSFAKLREVNVTYRLGALRGVGGDWTLGLVGRNLYTWTKYSGLDPETGATGGSSTNGSNSGLINQTDAFGFPTLRSYTFFLSTRF